MFGFLKQGRYRRTGKAIYDKVRLVAFAIVIFLAVIGLITVVKFVSGG